jgi:glycosyltransferase involved in cell wall biosynthesis
MKLEAKELASSYQEEPSTNQSADSLPLVTVVIPTYNSAQYIGETLKSVLNQEYPRLEVIVVDDGSTDNTKDAVDAFDSNRVTYLYQANSGGPARPRNKGIQQARGRYIALIDSDDIMLPGKIERAVRMLVRDPQLGLVFTDFVKFDEMIGQYPGAHLDTYHNFSKLPKKQVEESEYIILAEAAYNALISENYIGLSGVVMPQEVFSRIGIFDESLSGPEDYDMWLRITSAYDIGFIDMIGHRYRIRPDSLTSSGGDKFLSHLSRVMQKQLGRSLPDATRENIRKKLAYQLWELGYYYQLSEETILARRYYALSIRQGCFWLPCKGLLTTLLPPNLLRTLKKLRGY